MAKDTLDVIKGTLDLLVLKALAWEPMHGYAILSWLRRATGDELRIEDAALYPALHRLEARGLIAAEWGVSANNRRAKWYRLTARGRKALRQESEGWHRYASLVARVLAGTPGKGDR
jgi:transcriptional regulator